MIVAPSITAVPVRVGPLLLCLCVALYRAAWLTIQLSSFDWLEASYLLVADAPVLGALAILASGERVLPRRWNRAPLVASVVLVALYLADVATVLSLNARLQLSDLHLFGREWWLARSFVSITSILGLLLAASSFLVKMPVSATTLRASVTSGVVLLLLPWALSDQRVPSHLRKYTGSVLRVAKEVWGSRTQPVARYGPADFAAYRREYDGLFEAPVARTDTDIVLVMVESLSAADSYRTSGLRDMRARFDALSREGVLFRNFFANYEASEGGIVALLSGVPPVHFPTASTNTFAEYALQRSMIDTFRRAGYRCEFLTSVPMQFISMDAYARSPFVGFTYAAGQRETARYTNAPRFSFESPADRVLYEEVLSRIDARGRDRHQPVLMAVITASSHPPFVDPLGRGNNEDNAWGYVQDQLWWLHDELAKRGFFEHGVLIITGDHRRMAPVPESERKRYGESAKARIPLLVIGKGAPKGALDDRLFQQADLLRMLDRALQPTAALSPFVVWVERYMFVYGVASNASNLEIFDASNQARQGFPLRVHGADIEWLARPANALTVERAIHGQRALQQAVRAARLTPIPITYGRELTPSADVRGMLVGVSTDVNLSRDPDDPRGSLKLLRTDSFGLDKVVPLVEADAFTLTVRAFMSVPRDGEYWFSVFADHASCLAIDKEVVLGCRSGLNEGVALLAAGLHRFDLRFMDRGGPRSLALRWLPPGAKQFTAFPQETLIQPEVTSAQ